MDNVLTESKERAFHADVYNQIKDIIREYKTYTAKSSRDEQEELKCAQWHVPVQLVDVELPKLITELQDRSIKTLMLTQNPYGKLRDIESIEEFCHSRLKSLGIDFDKSWRLPSMMIYDKDQNVLGSFHKGGIFTLNSKELALEQFLKNISSHKFNKIVFVDDKRKNLEKVWKLAEKLGMEYIGIEYTKAFTKKRKDVDVKEVKQKFDLLLKLKKWESIS